MSRAGAGRSGRAAPLRRRAKAHAGAKGGASAASAGDDRDPDPAHADTHPLWGDGHQPAGRDAARTSASGNARHEIGRASGRERGCTYVEIGGVAGTLKKKKKK